MIILGNNHRFAFSSAGCINKQIVLFCILNNSLYGSRVRSNYCNNLVGADKITKTDINKLHLFTLFEILNLFTDFFNLTLDVNNLMCKNCILNLGTDCI